MHYNIQKLVRNSKLIYNQGFSLLEVLIALFVLSVGLLGLLSLQTITMRRNYEAYLASIATTQIQTAFYAPVTAEKNVVQLLPQGKLSIEGEQQISVCWFSRLEGEVRCLRFR